MKRLLPVIAMIVAACILSGCNPSRTSAKERLAVKADRGEIEKGLREIVTALNLEGGTSADYTLRRFMSTDLGEFSFGGTGLNRLRVDGIPNDLPVKTGGFTLDDFNIDVRGDSACVTGYLNGFITTSGKELERGPWRLSAFLCRESGTWRIRHYHLSRLSVPVLEYVPQLPAGHDMNPDKKWPMIVFLHGAGERGLSLNRFRDAVDDHSVPMIAATNKDFPFIVISPLCPSGTSWVQLPYSLYNLIDEAIRKYNADPDRVYLTGLSMGGMGTWSMAIQYPRLFAAIAPVCGRADTAKVDRLRNLPVWAFHGAQDNVIPVFAQQAAVDALRASGGDVRFTVYPDVEHDSWHKAYATKELYDWFLSHRRER